MPEGQVTPLESKEDERKRKQREYDTEWHRRWRAAHPEKGREQWAKELARKKALVPMPGKPVPGLPEDEIRVSRDGSVWSYQKRWTRWMPLKVMFRSGCAKIYFQGGKPARKPKWFSVAALVCRAFHGPRPLGCVPFHYPDTDRMNCHADNLRWAPRGTRRLGNRPRSWESGLGKVLARQKGEENYQAKLTNEDVLRLRELRRQGWTNDELAEEFSISKAHAGEIARGARWSHLPGAIASVVTQKHLPGFKESRS